MNITALNMSLTTQITDEQKFCTFAPPSSHSLDVIVFDILVKEGVVILTHPYQLFSLPTVAVGTVSDHVDLLVMW